MRFTPVTSHPEGVYHAIVSSMIIYDAAYASRVYYGWDTSYEKELLRSSESLTAAILFVSSCLEPDRVFFINQCALIDRIAHLTR